MSKFIINPVIKALFNKTGKKPVMKIQFLGTGGAFHPKHGSSSALLQFGKTILIDCGNDVFAKLLEQELVKSIDYVFITHTHEDHISSLSSLIYYKKLILGETLKIECVGSVAKKLKTYLIDVCGHLEEDFILNGNENGADYYDLNVKIHKIDYGPNHTPRNLDFPASGFVFEFKFEGEYLQIIYSGDINMSFLEWLRTNEPEIYMSLEINAENVFVFHEATTFEYPSQPHCQFKLLEKELEIFPNIFTYHHDKNEAKIIMADQFSDIYDLSDELLQMDKDAQDIMVGEVNTPENRVKFQIARDEVSKKLSELKKKPKLASLTFIEDAEFFIEKDNRL